MVFTKLQFCTMQPSWALVMQNPLYLYAFPLDEQWMNYNQIYNYELCMNYVWILIIYNTVMLSCSKYIFFLIYYIVFSTYTYMFFSQYSIGVVINIMNSPCFCVHIDCVLTLISTSRFHFINILYKIFSTTY